MARKIWIDPKGREIPANRVRDDEKSFEKIYNKIKPKAEKAHEALQELKEMMIEEFGGWLNEQAQYGLNDDWKGNAAVTNFSATGRLVREEKERIDFDHNIQIFQRKVYECLDKWGKTAQVNLKKVVDRAFKTNSSGNLSKQRLYDLRGADVQDSEEWEEACKYFDKAVKVVDSKAYWAIEFKDADGNWQRLPLNFYDISVMEEMIEEQAKEAA